MIDAKVGPAFPFMPTAKRFQDVIAIFLSGMAAERVIFGDHSAGSGGDASADLVVATGFATEALVLEMGC